jgi:hypothetical protein
MSLRKFESGMDKAISATEKAVDTGNLGALDSSEEGNIAEEFKTAPPKKEAVSGNTILTPEQQAGFSPDIQVTTKKQREETEKRTARPAKEIDLALIDESMIMDLPLIRATDFNLPSMLFKKPKDPAIRFRWVKFDGQTGNLGYFQALGYQTASIEDVDLDVTPVPVNMIDGTQIKWYDVLLMKINVLTLMGHYKKNQIKALKNVGRFDEQAEAQANQQFMNDLGNEGLIRVFNKMREAGHKVEFYIPGAEEKSSTRSEAR